MFKRLLINNCKRRLLAHIDVHERRFPAIRGCSCEFDVVGGGRSDVDPCFGDIAWSVLAPRVWEGASFEKITASLACPASFKLVTFCAPGLKRKYDSKAQ